jgi:hypothetical protein
MTRAYDDDIYFSPADVPPVAMVHETPVQEKSAQIGNQVKPGDKRIVMSQLDKNQDGTLTMNNNIYQPETQNSDVQSYQMDDQELVESDTTVYYNDDDVKYVINNYYDDDDMDFTYRINRFHRPFWGSSLFFDDWYFGYSPFYSGYYPYGYGWDYGWGYDPWYYGGWGYPYSYYGGYYSPFSFGFGGYWGGWYGGYGGYYSNYYNGYYNGYYGNSGGFFSNNHVGKRRSTEMNLPGGSLNNNITSGTRITNLKAGSTEQGNSAGRNVYNETGHTRNRTIDPSGNNQYIKDATIVNNRRPSTNSYGNNISGVRGTQVQGRSQSQTQIVRPGTTNSGNSRRSYEPTTTSRTYNQGSTTRQSQNYTPSYNKPRIVNQSNYNNSYTRPRTSEESYDRAAVKSANTNSGSTYSQPRSSSSVRQTYQSSSSYSSGSSSSPRSSSYSSPSNYSSPSYSSPSRSSSSSFSSGSSGGYSGGSSGSSSGSSGSSSSGSSGGSSGGSGGSGHRR